MAFVEVKKRQVRRERVPGIGIIAGTVCYVNVALAKLVDPARNKYCRIFFDARTDSVGFRFTSTGGENAYKISESKGRSCFSARSLLNSIPEELRETIRFIPVTYLKEENLYVGKLGVPVDLGGGK